MRLERTAARRLLRLKLLLTGDLPSLEFVCSHRHTVTQLWDAQVFVVRQQGVSQFTVQCQAESLKHFGERAYSKADNFCGVEREVNYAPLCRAADVHDVTVDVRFVVRAVFVGGEVTQKLDADERARSSHQVARRRAVVDLVYEGNGLRSHHVREVVIHVNAFGEAEVDLHVLHLIFRHVAGRAFGKVHVDTECGKQFCLAGDCSNVCANVAHVRYPNLFA